MLDTFVLKKQSETNCTRLMWKLLLRIQSLSSYLGKNGFWASSAHSGELIDFTDRFIVRYSTHMMYSTRSKPISRRLDISYQLCRQSEYEVLSPEAEQNVLTKLEDDTRMLIVHFADTCNYFVSSASIAGSSCSCPSTTFDPESSKTIFFP